MNSKNEFGANNLAEIAITYGSKLVTKPQIRSKENSGNFKRKKREGEEEEGEGSLTGIAESEAVGQDYNNEAEVCPSRLREGSGTLNTELTNNINTNSLPNTDPQALEHGNEGQHGGSRNLSMKEASSPSGSKEEVKGKPNVKFGQVQMSTAAAPPPPTSTRNPGETPAPREDENLLRKKTSTPVKDDQDTKGKLSINFDEDPATGSPAVPPPSSPRSPGLTPTPAATETETPSPRPKTAKRRCLCPPKPRNYASRNKEELKNLSPSSDPNTSR